MMILAVILLAACVVFVLAFVLNWLSYRVLKTRIIKSRTWDLNVCCGRTDGGGVNTDIMAHAKLPNMVLADPLHLPFKDKAFRTVLCSHAAEHMQDPEALMAELRRVGREVTVIVPPMWDLSVFFNFFEHRWIFLSFRKVYRNRLPRYIKLPMASFLQRTVGQRIRA